MSTNRGPYVLSGNKSFCNFCPGFCCYRLPGSSLLLTNDDINRIARYLQLSDGEVRSQFIENRNTFRTREDGSCVFLAQGKMCKRCTIHEARPRQCQEFPYDNPCPYLENEGLMEIIQPRIEESFWIPT